MKGERAFVLTVGLHFEDAKVADELLQEWAKIAAYCYLHEPYLYHYEVAQSDKRQLSYLITERYRSKEDYLQAHRSSKAFRAFRPRMRALQDAGAVRVSGDSYAELGMGFT